MQRKGITDPLELVSVSKPPGRNHVMPRLSPLLGMNVQDVSGNEAWRDTIDSTKVDPFDSQALR